MNKSQLKQIEPLTFMLMELKMQQRAGYGVSHDEVVYRYSSGNSTGDDAVVSHEAYDWQVTLVHGSSAVRRTLVSHGTPGTEPEWLANIVALAKVGGHIRTLERPPPGALFWFITDPEGTFLRFYQWD